MTEPAVPTALPAQLEAVVEKYISLRDKKAALKKKFDADTEAIDALMERAESYFMGYMKTNGLTSLPTKFGTPYQQEQTSVTVGDKAAFKRWLMEDPERFDAFIDLKANKTAVVSLKEETKDLPPGINWSSRYVVNVKRNS